MEMLTLLTALESEISFHLADVQLQIKRRSERAFIHLKRSIAADVEFRMKWQAAFNGNGETDCEKLGAFIGGDWIAIKRESRFTSGAEGPCIRNALPFAEHVRRALIRNRMSTSHSEAITGKRSDGTPLDGHSHAHYLPTDEDQDGFIDHIMIYAPRGFDDADVQALRSLKTIFRSGRPDVHLRMIEPGNVDEHRSLANRGVGGR